MKYYRPQRVSSLIAVELNKILLKELETPGIFLTITNVEVSRKLDYATVKISVWPSDKAEAILSLLQKRQHTLQNLLTRKLNIKPMPQIVFKIDRGPEKAAEVEKALMRS